MMTHGGITQGSKQGPIAFVIKINNLPSAANWDPNNQQTLRDGCDGETLLFMDNTTLSKVCDVSYHMSDTCFGNSQKNVERVAYFAHQETMEVNGKKMQRNYH